MTTAEAPVVLRRLADSHGDVWAATWADDGDLYVLSDDTSGFGQACWSNVAVSRLTGDSVESLCGATVNGLPELGAFTETGPDRATWKGTGLTCVDGVLHLAASRHRYGAAPYFIQQSWDAIILTSRDHGQTWHGRIDRPTFAGRTFSNPNFIQTGRDGADAVYVYAVSNDGSWNNGSAMTLGRMRREADPADPDSWQFWAGSDETIPAWVDQPDQAEHIYRNPGRTSMTGITWVEQLDRYCMPQWHYLFEPGDHTRTGVWTETIGSTATMLEFHTAPQPWGPWTLRWSVASDEGWYNPSIVTKPLADVPADALCFFAAGLGGGGMEFYNLNILCLPLDALRAHPPLELRYG